MKLKAEKRTIKPKKIERIVYGSLVLSEAPLVDIEFKLNELINVINIDVWGGGREDKIKIEKPNSTAYLHEDVNVVKKLEPSEEMRVWMQRITDIINRMNK